jgi:glutamate---cysteine ligase / carboxylate-amine ligase
MDRIPALAPPDPRRRRAGPSDAGLTMGVEEEFLLLDPETGRPVPRAAAVLARVGAAGTRPGGGEFKPELSATQLEATTGACTTLEELHAQLVGGRRILAEHAAAEHAVLVSAGLPVLGTHVAELTPGDRFERIGSLYRGVVAGYQCCACQVHVGVPDRETAVRVVNGLRPWLPTLLAMSVNSPWANGTDTGYGSWRMIEQARFPGSGVPPQFPSAAAYDARLAQLVDAGVLIDERMTFWLARPSAHLPTVEVRVADAATGVGQALLQAALVRALVRTIVHDGLESQVDDQVAAAAVWVAARHGLSGDGVDPVDGRRVPAAELAERLVRTVSPALTETGDLQFVRRQLAGIVEAGTGAERQRRVGARGPLAVVRMLAEQTVAGSTAGYPVPRRQRTPGGRA